MMDNTIVIADVKYRGNSAEAIAIKDCGYLRQYCRVGSEVDRGWVTGEYGERMSKKDVKDTLLWCLKRAAEESPEEHWKII